jgi:hypothetical protein
MFEKERVVRVYIRSGTALQAAVRVNGGLLKPLRETDYCCLPLLYRA